MEEHYPHQKNANLALLRQTNQQLLDENASLRSENECLRRRIAALEAMVAQSTPASMHDHETAAAQDATALSAYQQELEAQVPYREFFEQLPIPIVIFRVDGPVVTLNRSNEQLLNTSRHTLIGKFNMFEDQEAFKKGYVAAFEKALQGEVISMQPTPYDTVNAGYTSRRDNPIIWTETTYFPIIHPDGSFYHVGEINLDVTQREHARLAQLDTQTRYQLLVSHLPDISVLLFNHEMRFLVVEGSAFFQHGIPRESLLNRTLHEVLPAQLSAALLPLYQQALQGHPQTGEYEFEGRYYQLHIVPLPGESLDKPLGMVVSQDITRRKLQEKELLLLANDMQRQASEQRIFYTLAENAPDAIAVARLDTGQVSYANPSYRAMLGYGDASVGMHFADTYAEDPARLQAVVQEAVQTGTWQGIMQYRRQDGSIIAGQLSGMALCDGDEEPWAVAGIIRDISAQQEYERQLQVLEAVIQHTTESVMLTDVHGIITYMNPAGARAGGANAEDIRGYDSSLFVVSEERTRYQDEVLVALSEHGNWEGRIWMLRTNGTRWLAHASAVRLSDTNQTPFAYAFIAHDMTAEERAAQDLRRLNIELARAARLKDEFLASMSHELRTPLTAILGMAELIRAEVYGPLSPKQRTSIRVIDESGQHLLRLITDILDLAKIEAGKAELDITTVTVMEACQSSLRMIEQSAAKHNITIQQSIEPHVTHLQVDERRFMQMLVNLLSNAVKFTPEGGQIGLDVRGDLERQTAYFTIWDSGIGIVQEDLERIFMPFVQLDGRLARQYEGSGLGLALVARFVEMHGGTITVESNLGEGSRFVVSLPWYGDEQSSYLSQVGENPSFAQGSLLLSNQNYGDGQLILLAEDNEQTIEMVASFLDARGYRLRVARDGAEVLRHIQHEQPALILMDIQMPTLNGLETIRTIRTSIDQKTLPIIALTALAMPGGQERCLDAGANDYVSKPVSLKHLQALIELYL